MEITTFSYVQINSISYKMSKVMQLMANSELNSKNPASKFRIFFNFLKKYFIYFAFFS